MPSKPPIALTVAGFDPSSGAGITADLAVFAALGLYGTSAISVMTVQSTLGVAATHPVSPEIFAHTLTHLEADLPPAGVKIGALGNKKNVTVLAEFLRLTGKIDPKSPNLFLPRPVVFDPILRSSSGHELFPANAVETLHTILIPLIDWITPNWNELSQLSNLPVSTLDEAKTAAEALAARHPHLNIVFTGGDQSTPTDHLRTATGDWHTFPGEHLKTSSTHGTGCAFSSALLARLILGDTPADAVAFAKHYVTEAIRTAPQIGNGKGPLNLLWPLTQSS